MLDIVLVAHHLGQRHANLAFDVNGDGKVNVRDLLIVVKCRNAEKKHS